MAITATDAATIVARMLEHPQSKHLTSTGDFRIVAKATARFLGEVADCSGNDTRQLSLWYHLVPPIPQLVTVPATTINFNDSFRQRISNASDMAALKGILCELYEFWGQNEQSPARKRKISLVQRQAPATHGAPPLKKAKQKGPNIAILDALRRKTTSSVLSKDDEKASQANHDTILPITEEPQLPPLDKQASQSRQSISVDDDAVEAGVEVTTPSQDGPAAEKERHISVESDLFLAMDIDSEDKGEDFINIDTILNHLEDSVPSTLPQAKAPAVPATKSTQNTSHVKAAQIGSELAHNPAKRIERLRVHAPQLFATLPTAMWEQYNKRLLKVCKEPQLLQKGFLHRLGRIMDIIYLPEELVAFRSGNWARLEVVLNLCVAIADTIGPEDEAKTDAGSKWVEGKLKDIEWLKRISSSVPNL